MNPHLRGVLLALGDYGAVGQQPEPPPEHPHMEFLKRMLHGAGDVKDAYQRGVLRAQQDGATHATSNAPPDEQHRWAWHAGYAMQRGLGQPTDLVG